jgi:hypothetical protein
MKRKLVENENLTLFAQLRKQFGDLTDAFESLLIPFSLIAMKEGKVICLQEAEINSLLEDYDDFKRLINTLIKTTSAFIKTTLEGTVTVTDGAFIDHINQNLTSTLSLYQAVLNSVKKEDTEILTLIKNVYFAYTMLARLLNTGIRLYNERIPEHPLRQIEGIPDPQYLDIDIDNTEGFLERFFQKIDSKLE